MNGPRTIERKVLHQQSQSWLRFALCQQQNSLCFACNSSSWKVLWSSEHEYTKRAEIFGNLGKCYLSPRQCLTTAATANSRIRQRCFCEVPRMHAGMAVGATKIDRLRATNEGEEKLLCQELAKIERQRRKRLRGLLRVQANLRSEVFRRQSEAFILQQEERTLRAKIDDLGCGCSSDVVNLLHCSVHSTDVWIWFQNVPKLIRCRNAKLAWPL